MENYVFIQPNPITIPNLITIYGKWAFDRWDFQCGSIIMTRLWAFIWVTRSYSSCPFLCAVNQMIHNNMVYIRDILEPWIPLPTPLPNNPASPSADFREKQHAPVHHIQPDAGDRGRVKQQGHRQPVQNLIGLLEHLSAKVTVFPGPPCPLQEGKGKGESCSHSNLGQAFCCSSALSFRESSVGRWGGNKSQAPVPVRHLQ